MKEYKIEKVASIEQAEKTMNDMAKKGWEVVSTAHWRNAWAKMYLLITFSREV